jgi:prepilin-type N-terminal cleavage/methylation domain-containing protein
MATKNQRTNGSNLLELLCVIAIISVLVAIYLGAIAKAFLHVKKSLSQ